MRDLVHSFAHHRCQRCGTRQHEMHVDHVVPRSLGGADDICNLQLLCRSCNLRKGARYADYRRVEYLASHYGMHALLQRTVWEPKDARARELLHAYRVHYPQAVQDAVASTRPWR